jgi:hypothetical protein
VCLLFCVACRSGAPSQTEGDWIKGRDALQSIMTAASQWSPDANAIRLFSGTCKKPPRDGVCNEWRAIVVSVAKKKSAGFLWQGGAVTHGEVSDYEPQDKQTAIEPSRIKADSDAAFRVSEEHGGRSLLEKNPDTEIRYAMMWDKGVKQLVWLVFYDIKGTDLSSAKLHVTANAETGYFLQ